MIEHVCDYQLLNALRNVSLHQRNGILLVSATGKEIEIEFLEGKIVSAKNKDFPVGKGIASRMVKAGLLAEDRDLDSFSNTQLSTLYQLLVGGGFISHEHFLQFKFSYEKDVLLSLRECQNVEIEFITQLVSCDEALSQQLYPCQLLLDFVEAHSTERRFQEIFCKNGKKEAVVLKKSEDPQGLTATELALWDSIGDGTSLEQLLSSGIFGVHQTWSVLVSLYEAELIKVGTEHKLEKDREDLFLSPEFIDSTIATFDMNERFVDADQTEIKTEALDISAVVGESNLKMDNIVVGPVAPYQLGGVEMPLEEPSFFASASDVNEERVFVSQSSMSGERTEKLLRIYLLLVIVTFLVAIGMILPQKLFDLFQALSVFAGHHA